MRLAVLLSCVGLSLVPTASTDAQCQPAQYTRFGRGCYGSGAGVAPCLSANWNAPFLGSLGAATNFAVAGTYAGTNPIAVCNVEFFTATSNGGPSTAIVWIYDRPIAGGPPGAVLGTTTVNVDGTPGICTATFTPPVVLQPNRDFFLVLDNRSGLRLPTTTSGTIVTHYEGGPSTWNGPFNSLRWNWQINCCAGYGAFPSLRSSGVPRLGGSFTVLLSGARILTTAMLFTGNSNTSWNGIPLPFSLSGTTGCSLLVSGSLISVSQTDGSGNAALPFALPADPALCGGQLFQQWIVLDQRANPTGLAFSNGGVGTIGS